MSQDMKIKGMVSVIVDAVDIDQVEIESPAILKESPSIKAMLAARGKENFISLRRVCERNNHTIEYEDFDVLPRGEIEVFFSIRAKKPGDVDA